MPGQPPVTVTLWAKPPLPGKAKTRLSRWLGPEGAAEVAAAFLADSLVSLAALAGVHKVLATTEPFPRSWQPRLAPFEVWLQGEGDLGERLERILRRALDQGAPAALALGADSPGLPLDFVRQAVEQLSERDAVLGPTRDGGYYLLGLRQCPEGLLAGLPWSSPQTLAATEARLQQRGLTVARTPTYFDVDLPEDLERLARHPPAPDRAPATSAVLKRLPDLAAAAPRQGDTSPGRPNRAPR